MGLCNGKLDENSKSPETDAVLGANDLSKDPISNEYDNAPLSITNDNPIRASDSDPQVNKVEIEVEDEVAKELDSTGSPFVPISVATEPHLNKEVSQTSSPEITVPIIKPLAFKEAPAPPKEGAVVISEQITAKVDEIATAKEIEPVAEGSTGKVWTCNKCNLTIALSEGEPSSKNSLVKNHKRKCKKAAAKSG